MANIYTGNVTNVYHNAVRVNKMYSLIVFLETISEFKMAHSSSANPNIHVMVTENLKQVRVTMERACYGVHGEYYGTELAVYEANIVPTEAFTGLKNCSSLKYDPYLVDADHFKCTAVMDAINSNDMDDVDGYYPAGKDFWDDTLEEFITGPLRTKLTSGDRGFVFTTKHPNTGCSGRFWMYKSATAPAGTQAKWVYDLDNTPDPNKIAGRLINWECD